MQRIRELVERFIRKLRKLDVRTWLQSLVRVIDTGCIVARLFLLAGKIVWRGCWRRSNRFIGMRTSLVRRKISPCQWNVTCIGTTGSNPRLAPPLVHPYTETNRFVKADLRPPTIHYAVFSSLTFIDTGYFVGHLRLGPLRLTLVLFSRCAMGVINGLEEAKLWFSFFAFLRLCKININLEKNLPLSWRDGKTSIFQNFVFISSFFGIEIKVLDKLS